MTRAQTGKYLLIVSAILFCILSNSYAQENQTEAEANEYRYEELVQLARMYGIDSSGSRIVLQERLSDVLAREQRDSMLNPPDSDDAMAEIERADQAAYRSLETGDELELEGTVVILVKDEQYSVKHRIAADKIIYNQKLRQLSATGNVHYQMENSDGSNDEFYGDQLLFLLDENEALFQDGLGFTESSSESEAYQIFQSLGGDETIGYRFQAELITRMENNVVIMDNGQISSVLSPESPYYRLDFDKLWILSPGEWGLAGARLMVGHIPMLALPFFYLPGNEVVFHPAFVLSDFRGYGLNTTTYLVGEVEKSDSSFSFLQMADDTESSGHSQMGIFLQPDESEEPNNALHRNFDSFKIMADLYSSRGVSLGLAADTSGNSEIDISALAALVFTRELYLGTDNTNYSSSYTEDEDGSYRSVWNQSRFLGEEIPFRFIIDIEGEWSNDVVNLDIGLPIYSDPYVYDEFTSRLEQNPWDSLILGGSSESTTDFDTSSMSWDLTASLTADIPEHIDPYISSLKIGNLVTSLDWQIADNPFLEDENDASVSGAYYSPEEELYAPQELQYPSGTISMSGTLLQYHQYKNNQDETTDDGMDDKPMDGSQTSAFPSVIWSPNIQSDDVDKSDIVLGDSLFDTSSGLVAPNVNFPVPEQDSERENRYSLSYTLSNTHFVSTTFHDPDENDTLLQKYDSFQDSIRTSLNQSVSLGMALSFDTQAAYAGVFRSYFHFSDLLSETEKESLRQSAYSAESQKLTLSNTSTLELLSWLYGDAELNLSHSATFIPWSTSTSSAGNIHIEELGWNSDTVTEHSIDLNFSTGSEQALSQSFGLGYELPPQSPAIDADYRAEYSWIELAVSAGAEELDELPEYDDAVLEIQAEPRDWLELETEFAYSVQHDYFEEINAGLTLGPLESSISWEQRDLLELNSGKTAWVETGESSFELSEFDIGLDIKLDQRNWGVSVFDVDWNISWEHDFVEFTESDLSSTLSFSWFINRFMLIELSTTSSNSQMYRYFSSYNESLGLSTRSIVKDLLKSFNFFSSEDRRDSFFKLESYEISLLHDLGDWMLSISYEWEPVITTASDGSSQYEIQTTLNFFLQWLPITELSNEIDMEILGDELTVEY